jgi:hypothetical protein
MTGEVILGIDPGLDGALAFVSLATGQVVAVFDVPTLKLKNGRVVDEYRLGALVDEWSKLVAEAWIEKAWPRPGEAATLSFAFGRNYGELRGAVTANLIPLREVGPAQWKRVMGVTSDKDEARLAASTLWPADAPHWPLKKHHGRAEAALIAAYGRREYLKANADLPGVA